MNLPPDMLLRLVEEEVRYCAERLRLIAEDLAKASKDDGGDG